MKMSEDKKIEFQAKRWSDNKSKAIDHKWYAVQRMDLLIISISGAMEGIIFSRSLTLGTAIF